MNVPSKVLTLKALTSASQTSDCSPSVVLTTASKVRATDPTETVAPSTPNSSTSASQASSITSSELSTILSYTPGAATSVAIPTRVTPSTFLSRSLVPNNKIRIINFCKSGTRFNYKFYSFHIKNIKIDKF